MAEYKSFFKRMLFFDEPEIKDEFVLKENKFDQNHNERQNEKTPEEQSKRKKNEGLLLKNKANQKQEDDKKDEKESSDISKKLEENLNSIKEIYSIPLNGDVVIREFDIIVKDRAIAAFIVFFDGMTDRKVINDNILQPLMILSNLDIKNNANEDVATYVRSHILPHNQMKEVRQYEKLIDEVNFGGCALFIDGIDSAFTCDVKGWEHRGVDKPTTELVIRGPQEAFNESLRANTALIRKRLKDKDLMVENISIGIRSKTPCSMLYIKDIANKSLVDEVRRRLKSIRIDYLQDSGELEQLIEDSSFLPAPLITATERPDRAANMLTEGKVAIVVNGSPFVLVLPTPLHELIHSSEDSYVRFPYANLLRGIRLIGIFFSLLLPGIYVAITNYHHEMIPTDLLFAIEASRERVPFPSVVEILIMEVSFELIREAGIRIPGPIGPTLGIIGALILGQAAVAANIVSPILIIVVAVTGIGSFAVPNFSLGLSFRMLRFGYIILGAMAGFLGLTTGLFIQGLWFVGTKSFGVPFLVPFAPKTSWAFKDSIFRTPKWMQDRRPDYMNTQAIKKQPKISRGWTKPEEENDRSEE